MKRRPTQADIRRVALEDARATVRADILLDGNAVNYEVMLDRVTRSLDLLIERTK